MLKLCWLQRRGFNLYRGNDVQCLRGFISLDRENASITLIDIVTVPATTTTSTLLTVSLNFQTQCGKCETNKTSLSSAPLVTTHRYTCLTHPNYASCRVSLACLQVHNHISSCNANKKPAATSLTFLGTH